ncbi:MAG: cation-transporting P-type ATPase, partial [Verrucomicrobia bacterium]|nr:cation-transporting P-type ATPase [Verrucomicrobiota bacterium]
MSGVEVLRESGGSHGGLNDEVVKKRLALFGSNTLAAKDQEPWYLLFLEQFANPLVYMLIGAAVVKGSL